MIGERSRPAWPPTRHCAQAPLSTARSSRELLKAFLVLPAKRFRKAHSLAQLGAAAQASFPDLAELVAAVENWTVWAVAYRYPLAESPDEAEPDDDELQHALATTDALAARRRAPRPQD